MAASADERTGVLVVRVWMNQGERTDDPPRLRARITRTLDVAAEEELISTAGSTEEVCETVRAWLDAFTVPGAG